MEGVLSEFREKEVLVGDTGRKLLNLFAEVGPGSLFIIQQAETRR